MVKKTASFAATTNWRVRLPSVVKKNLKYKYKSEWNSTTRVANLHHNSELPLTATENGCRELQARAQSQVLLL
jgi:hypothetical protein